MNLQEMREQKKQKGYSNEELALAEEAAMYSFGDEVPCSIYPDLKIKPASLLWT